MENQENGLTLGDIFRVIKKRILWIAISTVIIFIIGTVALNFVYNKDKEYYTIGFEYHNTALTGSKYPDGTAFRYSDLITEDALKKIVESDSDFSDIDYVDMVKTDSIQFSLYTSDEDADVKESYEMLSVKVKYFKDINQAREFMHAIIQSPIEKAQSLMEELNYKTNLYAFDLCRTTYSDKISYLTSQKNYLDSIYNALIDTYGSYYTVNDGKLSDEYNGMTLKQLQNTLNNVFSSNDSSYLTSAVSANYFVLDSLTYDFTSNAVSKIQTLLQEKKENVKGIEELSSSLASLIAQIGTGSTEILAQQDVSSFQSNIASFVIRNNNIDRSVTDIWNQIHQLGQETENKAKQLLIGEGNTETTPGTLYRQLMDIVEDSVNTTNTITKEELDDLLTLYRTELETATEIAREVKIFVTENETAIIYKTYNPKKSGGINLFIGMALALVAGFVLTTFVFCCIDIPKAKEAARKNKGVVPVPAAAPAPEAAGISKE